MSKKYSLILFLLIINIIKSNCISLNFHKDLYQSPYDIENVFFTSISTNISLGTPPKNITLQISTDTPYFVIRGDSLNKKNYTQENSSSFYFVKYGHSYSYRNIYFHSIFFDENFNLDKNSVKLNSMMCWGKNPITNNDGMIGLQLKDLRFNEQNIFMNQLYKNNIISNKIFSLIYRDENNGELIIGDYPINKTDLLKDKKFKICKNNFDVNGTIWGTIFEKIDFYENKNNYQSNFQEKSYIGIFSNIYYSYIGSSSYNYYIYETFFKEKINSKNCWIQTIDDDKYFGYVCSKNTDIGIISPIKFYHKELNYTFEITNNDMWISRNNIKYFLIFFSYNDQYSWTLGQKFLQKYNLVFDSENNLIGIYYSEESNIFNYARFFIGIFIVGLIFGLIILIIYKYIKKNKREENEEEIELNLIENNKM